MLVLAVAQGTFFEKPTCGYEATIHVLKYVQPNIELRTPSKWLAAMSGVKIG